MNQNFDSGTSPTQPEMTQPEIRGAGYVDYGNIDEPRVRLDESRREFKDLFAPPERPRGKFTPRSKIMRALAGKGGLALMVAGAGGLLLAKPKLVKHFVRMIPLGTLARVAAMKFMGRNG